MELFHISSKVGNSISYFNQRGFTEKETKTLKNMLQSKFAGMCLKNRAEKEKEFEERYGGVPEPPQKSM